VLARRGGRRRGSALLHSLSIREQLIAESLFSPTPNEFSGFRARCPASVPLTAPILALSEGKPHLKAKEPHDFKRDERLPEWHGWHACRRGLGSNLYALGVPEKVIQLILRHANVSTTNTYYIKPMSDDVLNAMANLEEKVEEQISAQALRDSLLDSKPASGSQPETVN